MHQYVSLFHGVHELLLVVFNCSVFFHSSQQLHILRPAVRSFFLPTWNVEKHISSLDLESLPPGLTFGPLLFVIVSFFSLRFRTSP